MEITIWPGTWPKPKRPTCQMRTKKGQLNESPHLAGRKQVMVKYWIEGFYGF